MKPLLENMAVQVCTAERFIAQVNTLLKEKQPRRILEVDNTHLRKTITYEHMFISLFGKKNYLPIIPLFPPSVPFLPLFEYFHKKSLKKEKVLDNFRKPLNHIGMYTANEGMRLVRSGELYIFLTI